MVRHGFSSRLMREVFKKKILLFENTETDVFRLFNRAADGFEPIAIDKYGDYVVVYVYEEIEEKILNEIYDLIESELRVHGVYEKKRFQNATPQEKASKMGVVRGTHAPEKIIVRENGVLCFAYLNEGISTGIFFDQRENRLDLKNLIEARPNIRNILNAFSYTGFFSVYLAKFFPILKTTSVDLSKTASTRASLNFELNNAIKENHRVIAADFIDFVKKEKTKNKFYDLIILDPPTFSRSKNSKNTFSVKKDIFNLAINCMDVLNNNGFLFLSVNTENLEENLLRKKLLTAFANSSYKVKEHKISGQAQDFTFNREHAPHLRCFLFEKIF